MLYNHIDSYIILNRNSFKILVFTIILFLVVTSGILIILNYDYQSYFEYDATYQEKDNGSYLFIPTFISDIDYICKNDSLIINKKSYHYSIDSISDELYTDNYMRNYRIIYLKINIDSKYQINNYVMKAKFKGEKKKLIKYFLDF